MDYAPQEKARRPTAGPGADLPDPSGAFPAPAPGARAPPRRGLPRSEGPPTRRAACPPARSAQGGRTMMRPLPAHSTTEQNPPNAAAKRAAHPLFVPMWAAPSLQPQLPFLFPVDPNLPPSPKRHYRSQSRSLVPQDLLDKARPNSLSDFEIALRLIAFTPLERML